MAATCKSCGAPLVWIRSHNAKWIPCDEGLKPYKQTDDGKEFVVAQDGDIIRCTFTFEGFPTGMARTPHWATCPEADRFRRKADARQKAD